MFENTVNEHSEKQSRFGKASSNNFVDMTNPTEMRAIFGNRNSQTSEDDPNVLTMTNPFGNSNWSPHESQNLYSHESDRSLRAGQNMQPDQTWRQNSDRLGNQANSNQLLQKFDTDLQKLATLTNDLSELAGALGGSTGGSGSDSISSN